MDLEAASSQIDTLIDRRAEQGAAERAREALWAESVRRDKERRRRENLEEWYRFEMRMCTLHAALSEEHRIKAEKLLDDERGERPT